MTCAICTADAPCEMEPLGRDDRLVPVCEACRTETPREAHGVERGYEAQGGFVTHAEVAHLSVPEKDIRDGLQPRSTIPARRIPGLRLYRIARRVKDRLRTFEEAQEIAMTKPWWGRADYVGADARNFCWQEVIS